MVGGIVRRARAVPRRSACATLVVVGSCVAAAPVSADADVTIRGQVEAGPALAGAAVVWGKRYRDGRLALVVRAPDGTTRSAFDVPPAPPPPSHAESSNWLGGVVASQRFVGYEYGDSWVASSGSARVSSPTYAVGGSSHLMAGPLEGPLSRLSGDPESGEGCMGQRTYASAFDLDRSRIAYSEQVEPCNASTPVEFQLVVTDLATGGVLARMSVQPVATPAEVALASRYLALVDALRQTPTVYVYDWTTGELLYRVRHPRGQIYLTGAELRRDGALVLESSNARHTKSVVSVATRAAPRARPIIVADELRRLRVAGRRIFAIRGWGRQRSDDTWTRSEPFVADFRGRTAPLATYGRRSRLFGDADFNGDQAAWAAARVSPRRSGRDLQKIRVVDVERTWVARTKPKDW